MVLRMARPFKHPKTGVYWLRKHVPLELRVLDEKLPKEMRRSLGTKNPREARRVHAEMMESIEAAWLDLRQRAGAPIPEREPKPKAPRIEKPNPTWINDQQIEGLAGAVYRATIEQSAGRRDPLSAHAWEWQENIGRMALGLAEIPEVWADWNAEEAAWGFVEPLVRKVLEEHGLDICQYSWARLRPRALEARLRAIEQILREANYDWTPDAAAAAFPELKLPLTAARLWKEYVEVRNVPSGTRKRWKPIFDGFVAFVGRDDMAIVTEDHINRWRDHLIEGGLTRTNVKKNYLICLKAIFAFAVRNKLLKANPASGAHVEIGRRDEKPVKMRALSDEEAAMILTATLAPVGKRMSVKRAAAQRWAPWICAYTGCRVNEATQLRACDIAKVDGIWCFRFTPEAGTTKNGEERDIPIAPHLIEQGFLDYAGSFEGDAPLFHNSTSKDRDALASAAETIGGRLATWVRDIGVADPAVAPNHGWRHRFKVECAGIIPEAHIDYIQAHVPVNVGRHYNRPPPRKLLPWIKKIPRYDIPGLPKAPAHGGKDAGEGDGAAE
ncbi:MAG TPA: DUF6538 domain-containing protein [Methylosinus sp.]|jgi:integrase|uniref:DUF6538 domain-containing protein n=1 Tax=Methylosinus sp. TaxID=427 RepID=UPI002F956471